MILGKAKMHKYTDTNYKLSALNIKYYNFMFKFRYNKVCSGKVYT
jgi:hypothetical protein